MQCKIFTGKSLRRNTARAVLPMAFVAPAPRKTAVIFRVGMSFISVSILSASDLACSLYLFAWIQRKSANSKCIHAGLKLTAT